MKQQIAIFFVSDTEYPKLQKLFPGEYLVSYKEYSKIINNKNKTLPPDTVPTNIYVDIASFVRWCSDTKVNPNSDSRAIYAAYLLAQNTATGH